MCAALTPSCLLTCHAVCLPGTTGPGCSFQPCAPAYWGDYCERCEVGYTGGYDCHACNDACYHGAGMFGCPQACRDNCPTLYLSTRPFFYSFWPGEVGCRPCELGDEDCYCGYDHWDGTQCGRAQLLSHLHLTVACMHRLLGCRRLQPGNLCRCHVLLDRLHGRAIVSPLADMPIYGTQ